MTSHVIKRKLDEEYWIAHEEKDVTFDQPNRYFDPPKVGTTIELA